MISDEAVWSLEARQDGAATVLYARGELDLDTAPGLLAEVGRRLDSGTRRLVVDLAGLTFVDSTGLGAIVGCWRCAARATATFELVNPSPQDHRAGRDPAGGPTLTRRGAHPYVPRVFRHRMFRLRQVGNLRYLVGRRWGRPTTTLPRGADRHACAA